MDNNPVYAEKYPKQILEYLQHVFPKVILNKKERNKIEWNIVSFEDFREIL